MNRINVRTFLKSLEHLCYEKHQDYWVIYDRKRPLVRFESDQTVVQWLIHLSPTDSISTIFQKGRDRGLYVEEMESIMQELTDSEQKPIDAFDNYWIQWSFISDAARNSVFLKALKKHIRPGQSRVLDLGTGTGLWMAMALRLHAAHVEGIEASFPAEKIDRLLKKQGFDRRTYRLRNMHSSMWSHPGHFDIVIAELIGNRLFDEGLIPTLEDLFQRAPHLRQSIWIPASVTLKGQIFDLQTTNPCIPDRIKGFWTCKNNPPEIWDFMVSFKKDVMPSLPQIPYSFSANDLKPVSQEVEFCHVEFKKIGETKWANHRVQRTLHLHQDAHHPVLILWLEVHMPQGETCSNHPFSIHPTHWTPVCCLLPTAQSGHSYQFRWQLNAQATDFDLELEKTFHHRTPPRKTSLGRTNSSARKEWHKK